VTQFALGSFAHDVHGGDIAGYLEQIIGAPGSRT
jgi:hypothetical protein